jgi:undecaprenyl-diphosphatase
MPWTNLRSRSSQRPEFTAAGKRKPPQFAPILAPILADPLWRHRPRIPTASSYAPAIPSRWLQDAERLDVAVYAAIARTATPSLDRAMGRLSRAADYSRLSLASAAVLALTGGRSGRRAAAYGLASVGVTATLVNLGIKPLGRRRRPDRLAQNVPLARHVKMPASTSFPSGHSAAAFAFATGVGHVLPPASLPLRALAALVAYSRVHTGVHYPGDVIAGALMGTALAQITTQVLERRRRR